jgi:hypothetical protein
MFKTCNLNKNSNRNKWSLFIRKGPKYKLKGLMDDLLGGHLGGDSIHGLIEVLDEPLIVSHPLTL